MYYTVHEIAKTFIEELSAAGVQREADEWTWWGVYHQGLRPPRYPMPAIRYEWDVDFEQGRATVFILSDAIPASGDMFDIEYRLMYR